MINLTKRATGAELMDDFSLPASELVPVLKGLALMNRWFGGHKGIIKALKKFGIGEGDVIADWGCGGGDTLRAIAKWANRQNINVNLIGIDAAPATVQFAQQESTTYPNISYKKIDVLDDEVTNTKCDIIICSLFTHHFDDVQWVQLIRNMYATASRGIIITDLHRHPVLYYAVKAITFISGNKMVQYDGPQSVRRGFKRDELLALLHKAQIDNFNLTWKLPFRWELVIRKA